MISGHQVSHSKDNMSVMIQVAFSLLFVTLVRAGPANLDGGKTATYYCGLQDPPVGTIHAELLDKIVGGVDAYRGEYPWMVTMGKITPVHIYGPHYFAIYGHTCGASLITQDWLLTSAECFVNRTDNSWDNTTSDWTMKLGISDYGLMGYSVVNFKPSKIIIHPSYDFNGRAWNIALVKMPFAIINVTTRINTVCLHESGDAKPSNGTKCIVTGWGKASRNGSLSDGLKQVEVYILDDKDPSNYCGNLDPGMLCAGVLAGGKDSCLGDAGGPLFCPVAPVYPGGKTRYYQAGVTSFENGCGRPKSPSFYADVPYYLPWIKQTISTN